MGRKYTKHTGTFTARAQDGREFAICIFTYYDETGSFGGKREPVEGQKSLKTSDGNKVDRIEKGKYRIIGPEEIHIFSDDPNAP